MTAPVNAGNRLASMLLDHVIMTFAVMLFAVPLMVSSFSSVFTVTHEQSDFNFFGEMSYVILIGFALYLCKDSLNGRSIAKRVLKLQVVNDATGEPASPLRCFVRNIFCVIWPVEVIVALIDPSRRIGDRVAGTRVVTFDPEKIQPGPNWLQLILSLALAYGLMLIVMAPINAITSGIASNINRYTESSFNESESKSINQLFADSLGHKLKPDIRIYDRMENEDSKYISVILYLKNAELFEQEEMNLLKTNVMSLLHSQHAEGTFKGQIQYVYKTANSIKITRDNIY